MQANSCDGISFKSSKKIIIHAIDYYTINSKTDDVIEIIFIVFREEIKVLE